MSVDLGAKGRVGLALGGGEGCLDDFGHLFSLLFS